MEPEKKAFEHYSVMAKESLELLAPAENGVYVDCTFGGGGHSGRILSSVRNVRVIGIDRDEDAIRNGEEKFGSDKRLTLVHDNFANVSGILDSLGIEKINGAIMDLGVSSYQIDSEERGFTYQAEAPLDMRMDRSSALCAEDVVNTYPARELERIFREYGEERYSGRIASSILKEREKHAIKTTKELEETVERAVFGSPKDKLNSVKRIFQAVRIEVNGELGVIEPAIRAITDRLFSGGRIVAISFHSLEDRIVKNTFKKLEDPCECPKDFPVCVCGKKPQLRIITKKPLLPTEEENAENSRSHSAKLRAAQKL